MVPKIHPRVVIWVQSIQPQAGHLPEKNDDLAFHYEDVRWYMYEISCEIVQVMFCESDSFFHQFL